MMCIETDDYVFLHPHRRSGHDFEAEATERGFGEEKRERGNPAAPGVSEQPDTQSRTVHTDGLCWSFSLCATAGLHQFFSINVYKSGRLTSAIVFSYTL